MTDLAISITNLSKSYRVGMREQASHTLIGSMGKLIMQPIRNLRRLRRLATNGEGNDEADDLVWALRDVSLEIQRGEVIGIIGHNGAGKSTLLKILARITFPTSGYAEVHGRISSLLEVGTGFHQELTGRENVYMNGTLLGMTRTEINRKFDEIVDFSGVEKFIDTPVKHYSSGMKVRLAFSVAAHLEPEILLVDEVLAVGDAEFQKRSLGKLDQVSQSGRTVVFVSHQLNQIRRLCEKCIWFDAGKVRQIGATHDVISAYEAAAADRLNFNPEQLNSNLNPVTFVRWCIEQTGSHTLTHHDAVSVCFSVHANQIFERLRCGIVLYNIENQVIWSAQVENLELKSGLQHFVFHFPYLPLRPGVYQWYITLYQESEMLTRWFGVPHLIIATEPKQHPLERLQGFLNLTWQFEEKV
jgi:lipopolysaccharide transport system ATP-binding protein